MPSRDEVILSGEGLHLDFGAIMALDGVDFDVRRGEVVSIIGPNGAGKTCLINCVSGYYHPQRGKITFQRRELVGLKPHQVAYAGISRTAYYRFLSKNEPIRDRFKALKGHIKLQARFNIAKAIEAGNLEVSRWYLERRDPLFNQKVEVEVAEVALDEAEVRRQLQRLISSAVAD